MTKGHLKSQGTQEAASSPASLLVPIMPSVAALMGSQVCFPRRLPSQGLIQAALFLRREGRLPPKQCPDLELPKSGRAQCAWDGTMPASKDFGVKRKSL